MTFAKLTGRQYRLFDYEGPQDAERVVILMGSGADTAREHRRGFAAGGREGRRPAGAAVPARSRRRISSRPCPQTCRAVAVLEQTKEPGATGEPLYLDVVEALAQAVSRGQRTTMPRVIGGRYGLSSKDFNPGMAKAVFDELKKPDPRNGFTVGINDDVSHTSLEFDPDWSIEPDDVVRAVFYGLGSDGTVGANKNSVKIIAEDAGLYAQGYFVYDSHKSGAQTVSHLRFGPRPIRSPYLIGSANFVGCHQFHFLQRQDVLRLAGTGATFLLNSPYGPDEVWDHLPRSVQQQIIDKKLKFFVIDASRVAQEVGLKNRTNTVLQTCFFALSGVLPREQAIARSRHRSARPTAPRARRWCSRISRPWTTRLSRLHEVSVPAEATSTFERPPAVPATAPEFVRAGDRQDVRGPGRRDSGEPDAGGRHLSFRHGRLGEAEYRR